MTEATRLTRLRIAGFKSFAEPVSLDILPGLTGIVGPNGCGKSNVVEALRWAMGETSARSLRGGEMDDVIFAGTTARASRNLAEVTITLEGALPAPFEAESELQVTRRIERGAGSQFRANGRELRARDVQTLYADLASGARSSGMVSQGRVAQLVNAKPEERRQVLEEAAGITGLHARRHEAELKLRQAEQNLLRTEDTSAQLETARESLRKQARQASRYKSISGLIRDAEAEHLSVLHAQAQEAMRQAEAALGAARAAAGAAQGSAAVSGAALAEAEAAMPAMREAEAQARGTLERRRVEAESLAAESERLRGEAAQAESRLLDLDADCAAAEQARQDARASVDRLVADAARFAKECERLPAEIVAATTAMAQARAAEAAAQAAADEAGARCGENAALMRQAMAAADTGAARLAEANAALATAEAVHQAALAARITGEQVGEAAGAVRAAEDRLDGARAAVLSAETARVAAERAALQARGAADREAADRHAANRALQEAEAKCQALRQAHSALAGALAGLLAKRVPAAALDQAERALADAETEVSLRDAELASAEQAAEQAAALLAAAGRQAEDRRAASDRAEAQVAAVAARARSLAAEMARAEAEWAQADAERPDAGALAEAEAAVQAAEEAVSSREAALRRFVQDRLQAAAALAEARAGHAAAEADHARLSAEADGLSAALGGQENGVLGALRVPPGLEAAFGAAFGEAGDACLDEAAERFIRVLPPLPVTSPVLPDGARRLSECVEAPAALSRLLDTSILLPSGADGAALQEDLPAGISLVRQDGACWRWDGQVIRAGAPNAAATRLAQSNRRVAVGAARDAAAMAAETARSRLAAAEQDDAAAVGLEDQARAGLAEAERTLRAARGTLAALSIKGAQAQARLGSLAPMLDRLRGERLAADASLAEAESVVMALAEAPDTAEALVLAERRDDACRQALEAARRARGAARTRLGAAQADLGRLKDSYRDIESRIAAQTLRAEQVGEELTAAASGFAAAAAVVAALPDEAIEAAALLAAEAFEAGCRDREAAARDDRASAEQALDSARAALAAVRADLVRTESQLDAAAAALERCRVAQAQAATAAESAQARLGELPDQAALDQAQLEARTALDGARQVAASAQARMAGAEAVLRQAEMGEKLAAQELAAWRDRLGGAVARLHTLTERRDLARAALAQLGDAPGLIAARAEGSAAALAAAEARHRAAGDQLAAAEQRVRALALARRDAELDVAAKREAVLRAEAAAEAARMAVAAVLDRAAERLGEDAVLAAPEAAGPGLEEKARRKFERLTRERDEMGPVNLRAEIELQDLDEKLSALARERDDLGSAIAKLRGSIGHLNREGRARLEAVFIQVDQHFRTLFTRMMGGGRAHLALTGNDDPLQAGLEIYAEPPGKKLAALSLLSGGEQALTALSLIFAVFRCTPAPVSVLDEVDAPLDDANVERFCTLLDDVVRDTGTRFLVVTHHQLTMSRMDRLFGVTMQERGVSRLLSVDLQRAAAMVEPSLRAAE